MLDHRGRRDTLRPKLSRRLGWTAWLAWNAPRQGRYAFKPLETILGDQEKRVRATVAHAYRSVPYYRETLDRLGIDPASLHDANDLARLPVIERADLQSAPERFVSSDGDRSHYLEFHSGGSTGAPVRVCQDRAALFRVAACRERARGAAMRLAGKHLRARELVIADPPHSSGLEPSQVFRSLSLAPARIRVAECRMSIFEPPARSVEKINRFRPDILHSYGSYLEALFAHLLETRTPFHRPGVITFASDGLSDQARRMINREFGIPVLGRYGAIEAFNIGFECEAHRGYHVNADYFAVRIVDDAGRDLPAGHAGHVLVSNFLSRGTVLLNYRLGDVAARLPGPCPCGRSLPMISFLEGRSGDWLSSRSGAPVHPQAVRTLLSDEDEVWSYQIVQEGLFHFVVKLVTRNDCDREALRNRLQAKFAEQFGAQTRTAVDFVDSLPRTSGGKVRTVLSRMPHR